MCLKILTLRGNKLFFPFPFFRTLILILSWGPLMFYLFCCLETRFFCSVLIGSSGSDFAIWSFCRMEKEKDGKKFQPKKRKNSRVTKCFGHSSKEIQLVSASCKEKGHLFPKTTTDSVTGKKIDAPTSNGSCSVPPRVQRSKKRGRRGLVLGTKIRMKGSEFSCQRLQAYGLNPKGLRYRQLLREKRRKKQWGGGSHIWPIKGPSSVI